MKKKIVSIDEIQDQVKELKKQNKTVVATSGCFDILHSGHISYLREAKAKGDKLIVFLNSDRSVKELKGENRPIVSEMERAFVLSELESVDYICIFHSSTPCTLIELIEPDIFVKGGDYMGMNIPEMNSVKAYGGKVEYVVLVEGCSTTNIVEKIENNRRRV